MSKTFKLAGFSLVLALLLAVSMASAQIVPEPPSASKAADPMDINIAGGGCGNEDTKIIIEVTGAGNITQITVPINVVFAIDSSGSMGWNDPGNLRLAAAKSFIDKLDASRDKVGVVSWDDDIDWEYGLTSDFAAAKAMIDTIDSSGNTNLDAGLQGAFNVMGTDPSPDPVKVIIFLTDGINTYTYYGGGGPIDDIASAGYVVYSIGLSPAHNPAPLQDMAAATGGEYYDSPSADNLQAIFDAIFVTIAENTIPHGVDVVEITETYMIVDVPSISPPPASVVVNPDGTTTITWKNIGILLDGDPDLSDDETVQLSFMAKSSAGGVGLPVDAPGSVVHYNDVNGNYIGNVPIPQAYINVNQPPDAVDDSYVTQEREMLTVPAPGVLANDTDPDGDVLTVCGYDSTSMFGGTVVMNADGSFTYDPDPKFAGYDLFDYTICDGKGCQDTATVEIEVEAVNGRSLDMTALDFELDGILTGEFSMLNVSYDPATEPPLDIQVLDIDIMLEARVGKEWVEIKLASCVTAPGTPFVFGLTQDVLFKCVVVDPIPPETKSVRVTAMVEIYGHPKAGKIFLRRASQKYVAPAPPIARVLPEKAEAVAIPAATRVLLSFPRPANPESWIPFELADTAEVDIEIFDVAGRLVRTLHLGSLAPGYYVDRSKAAYWDGLNNHGEQISSGIYFYRLTAGDYSGMERIVILK